MTTAAVHPPSGGYFSRVLCGQPAVWAAVVAVALVGLALRLFAASGDLWLDEIWSHELVGRLTSIDQVFWRINHDNNHFLNSVHLYLFGPDTPSVVQRALSIVLGVGTVVAAVAVTADRGQVTQVMAGLLFAVSYPMVHYGSEARGYSGLILFTLASILCLERVLNRRGSRLTLAVAVLFGFLSHLTMLGTVLVLVLWAAWLLLRRGDGAFRAGVETVRIFLPPFLVALPLAICIALSARAFGFTVGGSTPFTLDAFVAGYSGMIRSLFGLPSPLPDWFLILTACLLVCLTAWAWHGRRASLYVIGIVLLPGLMAQLHLPNLEFPRYFLVSGVLLLLWIAETLGRGLETRGWRRWAAALTLAVVLLGNGISLYRFFDAGRGSYSSIVDEMTAAGPATYSSTNGFRIPKVVDFYAGRLGRHTHFAPSDNWCLVRPDWLIVEMRDRSAQPTEQAQECDLVYDRVETAPSWGLSGIGWALYRKRDIAG